MGQESEKFFFGSLVVLFFLFSLRLVHRDIIAASLAYAVAWAVSQFVNGATDEFIRANIAAAVSEKEKEWLLEHQEWKISREDYHFISGSLREMFSECDLSNRPKLREWISANAKDHLAAGFTKAHPNQGFSVEQYFFFSFLGSFFFFFVVK
jgi:hypothetical protein